MTARPPRAALRLGVAGAGAVFAFALLAADDRPAHADEPTPAGPIAAATILGNTPDATGPTPAAPPRAKPDDDGRPPAAVEPRPDRKAAPGRAPRAAMPRWASGDAPRPRLAQRLGNKITVTKPVTRQIDRVLIPVTTPIGGALDATPGPAGTALGQTRGTLSATTRAATDLIGSASPALQGIATDALAPLQPLLGPPAQAPPLALPILLPPHAEPGAPAIAPPAATVYDHQGPRAAASPAAAHAPPACPGQHSVASAATAPDAGAIIDASSRLAPPPVEPATPAHSNGHAAGADSLLAGLAAGRCREPQLHCILTVGDEPHWPAGRSPKPTPGPA